MHKALSIPHRGIHTYHVHKVPLRVCGWLEISGLSQAEKEKHSRRSFLVITVTAHSYSYAAAGKNQEHKKEEKTALEATSYAVGN